jgi:hypothetical protein
MLIEKMQSVSLEKKISMVHLIGALCLERLIIENTKCNHHHENDSQNDGGHDHGHGHSHGYI